MRIEFELRAEDGKEARRAYYRNLRPRAERYIYWLMAFVGLIFIADPVRAGLRALAAGRSLHNLPATNLLTFIEGWVLLFVVWFVGKHGPIYSLRRPGYSGVQELHIGEDGIGISSSGGFAVSSLAWHDFTRIVETENLFVLLSLWPSNASSLFAYGIRSKPASLFLIPKRAIATDELEGLRRLLEAHVGGVTAQRQTVTKTSLP